MAMRFGLAGFVAAAFVSIALWSALVRSRYAVSLPLLLALAALLRVALLFSEPALSGDVYRYLWDGNVSLHAINPYRYAPSDPQLASLRDSSFARMNHPEIPTIYPPYAQLLFAIAAAMHAKLFGWRALLAMADVLFIVFLFRRASPVAALAWAVSPLVVFEGAWNGHVDLVAAILVSIAVFCVEQTVLAAFLLALATGVKITPIASLPAIFVAARRRTAMTVTFVTATIVPLLPFALSGALMKGFGQYAHRWEFDSPLFTAIRSTLEHFHAFERLKSFWTLVKDPLHAERVSSFVYHHLDANALARAACGIIAVTAIFFLARSTMPLARISAWSIAALLLASPTIHPWYWLPVLALAIPARDWLLIILAHFSAASYLLYVRGASPLLIFAIAYAVPLVVAIVVTRRERRNSRALASARAS